MAAHAEKVLKYLEENGTVDSVKLSQLWNEDHQKIVGTVKSLLCLGEVITAELQSSTQWVLTDEGKMVAESGSHEALVYNAVPQVGGIPQAEIMAKVPLAKVGFSKAMSLGWISFDKNAKPPLVVRKVDKIEDNVQQHLKDLVAGNSTIDNQMKQEYKKRKLIQEMVIKSYTISCGPSFSTSINKQETDLTPEMIASGSWKTKQFKAYNLDAQGIPINRGHLHPLMKVRAEFRQIFLEMGFTEMPTNNFVESSFWNFDALFQPQQHPARDAHDTFFLSDPAIARNIPEEYMERVKKVHSVGGFGSQGYGYDWKIEEARKNLLRTHTTAVSARMLYSLAKNGFQPVKYFSIDRVFRNETLDATHLAEFHQVEGVIADYGLSLGHLIGILNEFFRKLGIEKLRFKPAYNPYTEPSMEIFSYHPGLGKWVEIGNSGIFRPEMLLPMGIPEGVSVLAWGLSLERPTMIKYGYDNIRDLVGPKVNLQMVADNSLCRLDKHGSTKTEEPDELQELELRMDSIMKQLLAIKTQVGKLKRRWQKAEENVTLVIEADPAYLPSSLQNLVNQLITQSNIRAQITVHRHSSLKSSPPNQWLHSSTTTGYRLDNQLNLTWIWKSVGVHPTAKIVNRAAVGDFRGEAAIARLLARLIESWTNILFYENFDIDTTAHIDEWIDLLEVSSQLGSLIKRIEARLAVADWLSGPHRGTKSFADVFLASVLRDKLQSSRAKDWSVRSCLT